MTAHIPATDRPDLPVKLYRYQDFREGQVYFFNGSKTKARLNYNYQQGQLQFIGPNRDTLLFTRKEKIRYVEIDQTIFYMSDDYGDLELIEKAGNVVLARKASWVLSGSGSSHSDHNYTAADDQPASSFINNQGGAFQWQNNTSLPNHILKTSFFLIDYNNRFHEASKTSFLQIYSRERSKLVHYMRKNKVDFRREVDLIALLNYCNQLL